MVRRATAPSNCSKVIVKNFNIISDNIHTVLTMNLRIRKDGNLSKVP